MTSALNASPSSDGGGAIDVVTHAPALSPPDVRGAGESGEFAYHRGRRAVPMHSPGDDLLADQHLPSAAMPRLPRLRNRVFFQSDESDGGDSDAAAAAAAAVAMGADGPRRRVLFRRRRKRQDGDAFWTAIFLANVLSLAVLGCLVVYLTQTDFFASHQNDLFGTTVDNRFTVVSQQDARAKIYLKSAPSVATDYVHAGKAVVFADGTVMTTAANLSGGVKEIGDLNLASASGSVVASAGGKPVLIVEPQGSVAFPSADADDPRATGVVVDGAGGRISIGGSFHIDHNANTSAISTAAQALHVNATRVVFGRTSAAKVTLTVPRPLQNDNSDDDNNDDSDDDEKNGDDRAGSDKAARRVKPTHLEVVGQSSSSQSLGGDVWIAGGDGLDTGGSVVIAGGVAMDADELRVGSVAINAQLEPAGSSFTEVGSQGGGHVVHIQGNIALNGNKSSTDNTTRVSVAGAAFSVEAKQIAIDNAAANASSVRIDSTRIRVGESALLVEIGSRTHSTMKIQAKTATMDAAKTIAIGATALHVSVGGANRAGQSIDVVSDVEITNGSVAVDATHFGVGVGGTTTSITLATTGVIAIGKQSLNSSVELGGKAFSVSSKRIELGTEDSVTSISGETISIDASGTLQLGEDADSIEVGSSTAEAIRVEAKSVHTAVGGQSTETISVGDQSSKATIVDGQSVTVGAKAKTVAIGSESPEVSIGSATGVINLKGKVMLNGAALESRERRLSDLDTSWFGYLNAAPFAVEMRGSRADFAVPFGSDRFASSEEAIAFEEDPSVAVVRIASVHSGHARLALALDSIRLFQDDPSLDQAEDVPNSKLRCRVQRLRDGQSPVTVLEASSRVERCHGAGCDSGLFLGLSGERLAFTKL
ncbi:hypothetical protein PybrP1_008285 [[Pythium] brassicae (nom. inval.)]|nr:hypothetical protein PybrP1_008285 [[Pythium] brassicae (nom. inval.)]